MYEKKVVDQVLGDGRSTHWACVKYQQACLEDQARLELMGEVRREGRGGGRKDDQEEEEGREGRKEDDGKR